MHLVELTLFDGRKTMISHLHVVSFSAAPHDYVKQLIDGGMPVDGPLCYVYTDGSEPDNKYLIKASYDELKKIFCPSEASIKQSFQTSGPSPSPGLGARQARVPQEVVEEPAPAPYPYPKPKGYNLDEEVPF